MFSSLLFLILPFFFLISEPPFIFYLIPGANYFFRGIYISSFFLMCLLLLKKRKIKIPEKNYIYVFVIQIIYFSLMGIFFSSPMHFRNIIKIILFLGIFIYIYNMISIKAFIRNLIILVIIIGILGGVIFILNLTGIISSPYSTFQNADTRTVNNYILTFSNAGYIHNGFRIIRIGGFFDEPGQFGLIITYMLLLNYITFRNKKYEILLILSGIFTFSLGFLISVILYYILIISKHNFKEFILVLCIFLIIFSLFYFNQNFSSASGKIYDITFGRLSDLIQEGVKSTNRSSSVFEGIKILKREQKILFGLSQNQLVNKYQNYDRSSIIGLLIMYGIIGLLVYFLPIFYLFLKSFYRLKNKFILNYDIFAVSIIIIINLFHRPNYLRNVYLLPISFIIIYKRWRNNNEITS